ncbi:MAG: DUF4176 domain-containing protein [Bacilli bacterium]|nr:DUF4176 domain-containing protein [Bacilli bacterium]
MEELLPIGSIVELKDGKRFMIIGYLPNKIKDEMFYDYIGCLKKGVFNNLKEPQINRDIFYFNKSDIIKVLYIGYSNDEFDTFSKIFSKVENIRNNVDRKNITDEEIEKMYNNLWEKMKESGSDLNEK